MLPVNKLLVNLRLFMNYLFAKLVCHPIGFGGNQGAVPQNFD